jgi:uncharacterized protein
MTDKQRRPGKFIWFELVTRDPKKPQAFYGEVLGWRTEPFSMGGEETYDMIYVGDTMIGGYAEPSGEGQPSHWISYVSVEDVDGAAKIVTANGGKVILPATEMPGVGRTARIADPQGAEICLFCKEDGDPPDEIPPPGIWLWNELHTPDPRSAVAFYEKVVGYTHKVIDMGPGGSYYPLGRDGSDRAGVTSHLPPGVPPHWLPYVHVEDPDETIARAKKLGAKSAFGPEDIPGVGRFGVFVDPTGARLAVMKPTPSAQR